MAPNNSSPMSLDDLANDCLLIIIEEVRKLDAHSWYRLDRFKSLKNLSLANKHFRQLCLSRLFTSDKLSLRYPTTTQVGTFNALAQAPFIAATLTAFKFRLVGPVQDGLFYASVVRAITAMPVLSELYLDLHKSEGVSTMLKAAFQSSKPTFPSIKTLHVDAAPNVPFVLRACPSLDTLIVSYLDKQWKRTLTPLKTMTRVRRFEMETSHNWTPKRLQELLPYLANVQDLCLMGELYKVKLSDLASSFRDHTSLEFLSITSTQWVNRARLSQYYFDDRLFDAIDDEQDNHYLNENPSEVARMFFETCPPLKGFRVLSHFDSEGYSCIRGADSAVERVRVCAAENEKGWYGFPTKFSRWS